MVCGTGRLAPRLCSRWSKGELGAEVRHKPCRLVVEPLRLAKPCRPVVEPLRLAHPCPTLWLPINAPSLPNQRSSSSTAPHIPPAGRLLTAAFLLSPAPLRDTPQGHPSDGRLPRTHHPTRQHMFGLGDVRDGQRKVYEGGTLLWCEGWGVVERGASAGGGRRGEVGGGRDGVSAGGQLHWKAGAERSGVKWWGGGESGWGEKQMASSARGHPLETLSTRFCCCR